MLGLGTNVALNNVLQGGYTEDQFVFTITTNMGGDYPYDTPSDNSNSDQFKLPINASGANIPHIPLILMMPLELILLL